MVKSIVEHSHPAIVSREMCDLVQDEIHSNGETGRGRNTTNLFGSRVVCGSCGAFYDMKVGGKIPSTVRLCGNATANISGVTATQANRAAHNAPRRT